MSFHVGQQILCVNDQFSRCPYWRRAVQTFPIINSIYTIREIREGYGDQFGLIGFCFYEFINPQTHFARGEVEPAFISKHFRPVRKTSIELFKKMLVPFASVGAPRKGSLVVAQHREGGDGMTVAHFFRVSAYDPRQTLIEDLSMSAKCQ